MLGNRLLTVLELYLDVELLRGGRGDQVGEAGGLHLRHLVIGHPGLEGSTLQPSRLHRQTKQVILGGAGLGQGDLLNVIVGTFPLHLSLGIRIRIINLQDRKYYVS